jgi:hypothetical protein
MTPADIITVMMFQAVQHASKEHDRQALVLVLGIMHHVITELPGDNSALLSYVMQMIKQFSAVKTL